MVMVTRGRKVKGWGEREREPALMLLKFLFSIMHTTNSINECKTHLTLIGQSGVYIGKTLKIGIASYKKNRSQIQGYSS